MKNTENETLSLKEQNQKLCKDLPSEIEIVGIALTRQIFINGEPLNTEKSAAAGLTVDKFDWGYDGTFPRQLALALLMEYLPIREATDNHQVFRGAFVSNIKLPNFKAVVFLKTFLRDLLNQELKSADKDGISPYFTIEPYKVEGEKSQAE